MKVKTDTTRPQIINGFRYRLYEIPELKIATTSELFDNLDVNQITDKKQKLGLKISIPNKIRIVFYDL